MNQKSSIQNPHKEKPDLSHRPDLSPTLRLATQAMHYELLYLKWEQLHQLSQPSKP